MAGGGFGAKVADMYAELTIRDEKYHAGMFAAEREAVVFVGKLTGTFGMLRGALSTIVAATAVRGAIGFFQEAIGAAANYQDVLNRTKAVLKGSADIVIKESDRMADKLGVVKTEYLSAASSFAASFKGAGFGMEEAANIGNQLTKLGMDLASFANTTNEDAFMALQAALRGEFDPIERYNVFINAAKIETEAFSLGLIRSKKDLDDHAKRMAALSLIMKQTKDAQDDLTNTIDDQNNAVRKLGGMWTNFIADLGKSLQPAVAAAMPELSAAMKDFIGFVGTHQGDIEAFSKVVGTDLVDGITRAEEFSIHFMQTWTAIFEKLGSMKAEGMLPSIFDLPGDIEKVRMAIERGDIKGAIKGAFLGFDELPDPAELSENQKRHLEEDRARRKNLAAGFGLFLDPNRPLPGAMNPVANPFMDKFREIEMRRQAGQAIAAQLAPGVPGLAMPQLPEPGTSMLRPEGMLSPEERLTALQHQQSLIQSLLPEQPRPSQMFTEGGSMEQQFQQAILSAGDPQVKELKEIKKSIDDLKAKLLEQALKNFRSGNYATIAPAAAARR
jgi:hypothetical protein